MEILEFELDREGVRDLLKSSEMASICEGYAASMTAAAGVPYVSDVYVGRNRVNARGVKQGGEKNDSRNHH